ncbi:FRAS1-related extracellular matrix protein 1a [Cheilinus undulatus]|uniref:FRAS1-related extracellular matrix protein 1a n=1 Tax=Cheilinus undulatus TaxID=241271 RepID=UPI001BD21BFD|nr:FRAS1-related extracellular matrix protein 1a [Cheilinus undulatus]XP_041636156.1 FRAS1-related extracellular matrix protein 1a [Cheilinus undulatus]XP_041636157.1 FRAS1-related extracellular matrix protein 1a [Cheilinus undulatus]
MAPTGKTFMRTLLPFLLLGITCSVHASLVKVNKGLKVKRGQSAYLQEGDLQFLIPRQKDACKVEVVLNEPITQRVGNLMPQVFDCHYLADEIKYIHNGSPLLKEDSVMLQLYRFTESETFIEVFSLHVDIMEPECSIIKLGPKSLQVPEFYGLSDAVDGNVVSFNYERKSSLECSIHLSNHDTHLPAHGQLVTGEPEKATKRGDEPESFIPLRQQLDNKERAMCKSEDCLKGLKLVKFTKIPCDDFLMMGLKYQHVDPPSPDIDYIAIRLDLKDTRSGSIYQSEQTWIPVRIIGAMPNQPPKPSFMSMFILEVDQFILTPFSTATLDAEDEETPKQLLVFNITKPPVDGFITHLSDHTRPISSFTWLDLNDMLIGYQPPNSSHTQRRNYEVEVEVHDFFFERSQSMTVHLSVRNADTNAPRVSWNMGLSLLEGQSRPILWEQLQIVDNDNLKAVRLITVDGLQHGRLTVRGGKGFMFTVKDIKDGVVRYHHDDSDSTKDFIIFRITDGPHQTRHKFPIKILPKDDSPPFLITNMLLEVSEGQTALLRGSTLQASDMDSSDDYILFNITRAPQAGEVMKIPGPGLTGYPISHFLQRDLSQSMVYYRHLGNEVFDDSFEVVLSDFHDPPNLSQPQVVVVHIEAVPDQPPKEVPGSSRCLLVKETEVVHLTRQQLHFVDQESPDSELTYTVTTPPFYAGPHSSPDAGRLFLVDSIPKFTKDSNAPVLRLFTQHAVNFMKVAYMPPIIDIGPYPQYIQFVLSVTNHLGKTVTGICFNITVVPVDNQPPQVITNLVTVDEGGEATVGPDHLLLSDVDSLEEILRVELQKEPQHGALQLGGFALKPGQAFTVQDLKNLKVRYTHDGSETLEDNIEFTATDGTNSVSFVVPVKVIPINDEVPVLVSALKPVLSCAEGEEIVITAEYIYATDADSDNSSLAFLIARQPYHGVVLRNEVIVDRFIQADITAGIISYKHTGLEIGLTPRHDTITFVISDGETETGLCCSEANPSRIRGKTQLRDSLPVYDLQITVFPVDSQPPSLTTGDIFTVDEGGSAQITTSHLKAFDVDTVLDELVVSLISPPQFGYIENVLPSPGFEKSNTGISIASFSYKDIMDGHVNYVQSRHQRMEPTADQFMLCISDGKHSSAHIPFYIIINPTNDEIPEFVAHNITVREGEMKQLDLSVLRAMDMDVPKNVLLFSVVRPPQHGSIISYSKEKTSHSKRDSSPPVPVVDFTMTDLTNGMELVYQHDDSENMGDSFTVQLTDGRHKLHKQVMVTVQPVNDEEPRVIRNNGLEVEPGEARLISSVVLFAEDGDTPSLEVKYMLESVPTQGLLQLKEGHQWVTLTVGRNCTQEMVDMNLLRYTHTDLHGEKTHDFFVFYLFDGKNRSPPQHFHISVKDLEKGNIAVFVKPVIVNRGDRVVLTTDALLATDGTDKPEELLYVITHSPLHGHIEYIKHPGLTISSFSQMDIAANLVAYVHDSRARNPTETFQFVVSNGKTSRNGTFEIAVEMVDRVLPSLTSNAGLSVPQGSSMILSPDCLALSDPDTPPSDLTFVLLQPPQYGGLILAGRPLTAGANFTQRDVQELKVTYKHDGGPSQIDRFAFSASDSSNRGFLMDGSLQTAPVYFTIQIKPLDKSSPEVVKLLPLWKAELLDDGRYGIFLSSHELKAEDKDSRDTELIFCIIRQPYFGYLENITTGGYVPQRFPQMELNRRSIVYIVNPDRESLSDSLEFTVSDPLGNTGPAHELEFSWSSIELSHSQISVCEERRIVSLDIIRTGNLAESAYVTIKVKEVTAIAGKDFLISPSSLVQFDPGVSKRTWQTEIIQDHLEEFEEKFEVLLVSPEGTVIGRNDKAQVSIRDSGQCRLNRNPEAPILGGKEIRSDSVPQHGSIQLEKLLLGTDSVIWSRGDSIPKPAADVNKKKIKVRSNPKTISPSSVFHNGTDIVYTYHGIMQMQVEDDTSPSRKGRKANIRVMSRGAQQKTAAVLTQSDPPKKTSKPRKTGAVRTLSTADSPVPKPCVPELMGLLHFNQTTNQLFHCNGVSWKPWAPTDQMVGAQRCPQGWSFHGGRCYILSTENKVTWSTANRACRERYKGSLASVLSKADMDWLWDFSGRKPFWIGLNDREGRGRWEWAGGESVSYTNWRKTPPRSKMKGNKKCVLVWRRAKWQIRDCRTSRGHRFVCSLKT